MRRAPKGLEGNLNGILCNFKKEYAFKSIEYV
jgi:hypothetical protein